MFKHQYSTNAGEKGRLGYHGKELNLWSRPAVGREEQFKGNCVTRLYGKGWGGKQSAIFVDAVNTQQVKGPLKKKRNKQALSQIVI